jgi:membrane dipeptidase
MGEIGGVIGVNCYDRHVDAAKVKAGLRPTVDDLVRHIDYIVEMIGIDHVGIGPDHFEDAGWSPAPGWMEGQYYGTREHYHVEGFEEISQYPNLTESLIRRGYSDQDIKKVLGENLLRLYRQILK